MLKKHKNKYNIELLTRYTGKFKNAKQLCIESKRQSIKCFLWLLPNVWPCSDGWGFLRLRCQSQLAVSIHKDAGCQDLTLLLYYLKVKTSAMF